MDSFLEETEETLNAIPTKIEFMIESMIYALKKKSIGISQKDIVIYIIEKHFSRKGIHTLFSGSSPWEE